MEKLNDVLYAGIKGNYKCNIEYTFFEHQLHTELIDLISNDDQYYGHVGEIYVCSDLSDKCNGITLHKDDISSNSQVIRLTNTTLITITPLCECVYYTKLDLHTPRQL